MRGRLIVLGLLLAASGCEALQLRNHVVRQAATLTDIQYQQVLDNLAMFRQDPAALPYFSLAPKGIVTIQLTDGAAAGLGWDYNFLGTAGKFLNHADKKNVGVNATQQTVGQWSTDSILNPDELSLMRCAYQRAVGCEGPECEKQLAAFFAHSKGRLEAVRPGWYGAGRFKDVPHGACHVAHYGDSYVWVTPEGREGLTAFTLAILDIATTLPVNVPDPLVLRLTDMEHRLAALVQIYDKLPDKLSPEGKRLKAEMETLLGQYNAALEERLKNQEGPESDLFSRIRKDFRDFNQGPNVLPPPP